MKSHFAPHFEGQCEIGTKYYTWEDHFGSNMLMNCGHVCATSLGDLAALLLGLYPYHSEDYTPKRLFKGSTHAARSWSHLSCTKHFCAGQYYMVCLPIADHEHNFIMSFQGQSDRSARATSSPICSPRRARPTAAWRSAKSSTRRSWPTTSALSGHRLWITLGEFLTSLGYTMHNLWSRRLTLHSQVVTAFRPDSMQLADEGKKHYSLGFMSNDEYIPRRQAAEHLSAVLKLPDLP